VICLVGKRSRLTPRPREAPVTTNDDILAGWMFAVIITKDLFSQNKMNEHTGLIDLMALSTDIYIHILSLQFVTKLIIMEAILVSIG
jgi:hypothetical protein